MPDDPPLSVLLSQVLVAYTVELDNLAELRLDHTTTRERAGHDGAARPSVRGPWLVSWSLWANVLQYVGPEGIRVDELHTRARTSRSMLGGLRRWRYVTIEPPAAEPLRTPLQAAAVVRATAAGRRRAGDLAALPGEMEGRWRARFGSPALGRLSGALGTVYAALPLDPPAYLPVVFPTQHGRAERPPAAGSRTHDRPADLAALLSGVLLAFTLDVEAVSRISLPIGANTLRVLDGDGVRVRDLPVRTGVSKEANAMCTGWLERHGCAEVVPEPGAARGKVVRLTDKGRRSRHTFAQRPAPHRRGLVHHLRNARGRRVPRRAGRADGRRNDHRLYPTRARARTRAAQLAGPRARTRDAAALPDGAAPRGLPRRQLSGATRRGV